MRSLGRALRPPVGPLLRATLLAITVGCAPTAMTITADHPAHPEAQAGRQAGPPAALEPDTSSMPDRHEGHTGAKGHDGHDGHKGHGADVPASPPRAPAATDPHAGHGGHEGHGATKATP